MLWLSVSGMLCVLCSTGCYTGLINMAGMWTHLHQEYMSPFTCPLNQPVFSLSFSPLLLLLRSSAPTQSLSLATLTGQTFAKDSLVRCLTFSRLFPFYSSKMFKSLSVARGLLAPGSDCILDAQEGCPDPRHPPRPGVWPQICWNLSFPGIMSPDITTADTHARRHTDTHTGHASI